MSWNARNTCVFHAIIGMAAKPEGAIWQPDEPVRSATCTPGAQSAGAVYQQLSIATGGLRFPLCNVNDDDPSNDGFGAIFSAAAAEAGAGTPRVQRRCARLTRHCARPYWSTRTRLAAISTAWC